jgi:hypothetical protein
MSKEAEFKSRFVAVLKDLQETGSKDGPAMWLLGSLASDLSDNLKQPTWSAAKSAIDRQTYDLLLTTFRDQGNENYREGRDQHAYAIQVLTFSLIALTQRGDEQVAQGEELLDTLIDAAVTAYRRNRTTPPAN